MQSAFDTIINDYDYETCKEIVNHGCQSGVCTKHIYYVDTIEFFTKHPEEITEFIKDALGVEALKDVFNKHDGNLDMYMNELTWTFIELVAMHVVDDYEDAVSDLGDGDSYYEPWMEPSRDGINPARSMTESRYAQV